MVVEGKDNKETAGWIALIITIGALIFAILWIEDFSEIRPYLLLSYLLVLALFLIYLFRIIDRIQNYRKKQMEIRYWKENRLPKLHDLYAETIDNIQPILSGMGSFERVIQKFFERPATPSSAYSSLPNLFTIFPGFHEVIVTFVNHNHFLVTSINNISDSDKDIETQIRRCMSNLCTFIKSFIKWQEAIMVQIEQHRNVCPDENFENARNEYLGFKANFNNMLISFDTLQSTYNFMKPVKSQPFKCDLEKRELQDFPKKET